MTLLVGQTGRLGGTNWEIRNDICMEQCVKQIANGNLLYSTEAHLSALRLPKRVGWEGGARKVSEAGDICIHTADSFLCTAENNTA